MPIPVSTRLAACEGLFHFVPKKTLAKTLGVSSGSIRDWAIYIERGILIGLIIPGNDAKRCCIKPRVRKTTGIVS